ncbi:hypothetical protein FDECE_3452 [Fusarium decemcellulare]|nr:hypothetical protein FDECE_3452 [Fusarium decemcellulare]
MKSSFVAPFAILQSSRSVDAQSKFYQTIDYVVDEGYEAVEDVPDEWFSARGVSKHDLKATVALRLPSDPYMHLIIYEWANLKTTEGWPAPFNQVGSRGFSLLVTDIHSELQRLRQGFPDVKVVQEPITIQRRWGKTTSVLLKDPEDSWLELVEIQKGSPFDPAIARPPPPTARTWLHSMFNCQNYAQVSKLYSSFGMSHDHGVGFRPDVGFHPFGFEAFLKQMKDAFNYDVSDVEGIQVGFLRAETDCSQNHIELMGYPFPLEKPGPQPTWGQRGIARYCIKTKDYAGALAKAKADGHKIYIEDQRGCLNWGDSQWFFFGDSDGNIVTLEEWFPQREWGERS